MTYRANTGSSLIVTNSGVLLDEDIKGITPTVRSLQKSVYVAFSCNTIFEVRKQHQHRPSCTQRNNKEQQRTSICGCNRIGTWRDGTRLTVRSNWTMSCYMMTTALVLTLLLTFAIHSTDGGSSIIDRIAEDVRQSAGRHSTTQGTASPRYVSISSSHFVHVLCFNTVRHFLAIIRSKRLLSAWLALL